MSGSAPAKSALPVISTTKYLIFEDASEWFPNRSTKVVLIRSVSSRKQLGLIQWYGAWRQYTFVPDDSTIWNTECLDNINFQIRKMMEERKNPPESCLHGEYGGRN